MRDTLNTFHLNRLFQVLMQSVPLPADVIFKKIKDFPLSGVVGSEVLQY